jgi:hypothetical protein
MNMEAQDWTMRDAAHEILVLTKTDDEPTALTAIVHIFGANFLLRSQLYQGVCGQKGSENAHRRGQ